MNDLLSEQEKQDLALLASGEADPASAERAIRLISQNPQAGDYLAGMRKIVDRLDLAFSSKREKDERNPLSASEISEVASRVRLQMHGKSRSWFRAWSVAALIAILAVPATLLWSHGSRSSIGQAELISMGSRLSGAPRAKGQTSIRNGGRISTGQEVAIVELASGATVILSPRSRIVCFKDKITLERGQCYVRSRGIEASLHEAKVLVEGEAILGLEDPSGPYLQVYSGHLTVLSPSSLTLAAGQMVTLSDNLEIRRSPSSRPYWLIYGLQELNDR